MKRERVEQITQAMLEASRCAAHESEDEPTFNCDQCVRLAARAVESALDGDYE